MWCKNVGRTFFLFVTIHAFDRQPDRRLSRGYTVRCITCSRTIKIHSDVYARVLNDFAWFIGNVDEMAAASCGHY